MNIMVVEKDPLCAGNISRFDLSKFLSNDRILLGTGEPNDDFLHPYRCCTYRRSRDKSLIFSPCTCLMSLLRQSVNELARQYLVIRPLMEVNVRTPQIYRRIL